MDSKKTLKTCKIITVGDLFTDEKVCKGCIIIPPNQRPYSWEDSNIDDFINDLEKTRIDSSSGYGHYFNMITFVRNQANIEIHDGQQRISTSYIALFYLAQQFRIKNMALVNKKDTPEVIEKFEKSIYSRNNERKFRMFSYNDELLECLLECKEEKKFLDTLKKKLGEKNLLEYKSNKKIIKLLEKLESYCENQLEGQIDSYNETFVTLYSHFEVVQAELSGQEQAYKIFELVNNRGKSLSDIDLVKNSMYKMAEESSNPKVNLKFVEQSIQELILYFGDDFEEVLTMHWLVYYNKSTNTNNGKPKKIYESFLSGVERFDSIKEFLSQIIEMKDKIKIYRKFINLTPTDLCKETKLFDDLKDEFATGNLSELILLKTFATGLKFEYTDYFLYYLVIEYKKMGKLHSDKLVIEYKKIISFYFIRSIVNSRMVLDKLNLRIGYWLVEAFGTSQNKDIDMNKLFAMFLNEEASDKDKGTKYIESISKIGKLISKDYTDITGYKLKTIFYFCNWFDKPIDYFTENGLDYTLIEEEHIVPKSAISNSESKYEKFNVSSSDSKYRIRIDWIGNKLLLTKRENGDAKASFDDKVTIYSNSNIKAVQKYYSILVKHFLNKHSLNEINVLNHERDKYTTSVKTRFVEMSSIEVEEVMLKIEAEWRREIGEYIDIEDSFGIKSLLQLCE